MKKVINPLLAIVVLPHGAADGDDITTISTKRLFTLLLHWCILEMVAGRYCIVCSLLLGRVNLKRTIQPIH